VEEAEPQTQFGKTFLKEGIIFCDAYTVPAVPETRPTACILGQL